MRDMNVFMSALASVNPTHGAGAASVPTRNPRDGARLPREAPQKKHETGSETLTVVKPAEQELPLALGATTDGSLRRAT